MIFKNILFGAILIAATAFAQPADSNTTKSSDPISQQSISSIATKSNSASLKKQQKIVKPATTWSKLKELFE